MAILQLCCCTGNPVGECSCGYLCWLVGSISLWLHPGFTQAHLHLVHNLRRNLRLCHQHGSKLCLLEQVPTTVIKLLNQNLRMNHNLPPPLIWPGGRGCCHCTFGRQSVLVVMWIVDVPTGVTFDPILLVVFGQIRITWIWFPFRTHAYQEKKLTGYNNIINIYNNNNSMINIQIVVIIS